ncbi:MAG: protein-L-isoaspartate(D-aspartate) O-methyltransferase [Fibrobacterota bacterium]
MPFKIARQNMVRNQLSPRGVRCERVLSALLTVPRHLFVDPGMQRQAYSDNALPLCHGQTISQPYIVAAMTELLNIKPDDKVLEIGTGSGYQAAVLAMLSKNVYSIERIEALVPIAAANLKAAGADAVHLRCGDGTLGWPEEAPFDKIVVTAGAPDVPAALFEQLREGGRMVAPLGNRKVQGLHLIEKVGGEKRVQAAFDCIFVPLIGAQGWQERA